MEGFFADPIYGGNRDMVAAGSCIGFPGARYDYRDVLERQTSPTRCRRWRSPAGRNGAVVATETTPSHARMS